MNKQFNFEELKKIPSSLTEKLTTNENSNAPQADNQNVVNEFFSHTEDKETFAQEQPQQSQQSAQNDAGYFQQGTQLNAGELFPTEIIIDLADNVLSKLLSAVATRVMKKNVPAQMLQATAKEKNTLQPAVKGYLNSINFTMSPLSALLTSIAAIYGSKLIEVSNTASAIKTGAALQQMNSVVNTDLPQAATGRKPVIKNGKPSRYMQKKMNLNP